MFCVVEMDSHQFDWLRSDVPSGQASPLRFRRESSVAWDRTPPRVSRRAASSLPVEQLSAGELERRIAELQDSIADLSGSRRRARSRLDLSPGRSEDVRAMGRASSTASGYRAPPSTAVDDHRVRGSPTRMQHRRTTDRPLNAAAAPLGRALVKLGTYDGSSPLDTFLAKFRICAEYYGWSARDRLFHLKASLEGHAGQVLWELRDGAREDDVIDLLRNRFGTTHQAERFRQELRTRRRKSNESIQAVYQDVRRLLALGYPGQVGEMYEVIGRDFFLDALDDQALRIRVLDQQPRYDQCCERHIEYIGQRLGKKW